MISALGYPLPRSGGYVKRRHFIFWLMGAALAINLTACASAAIGARPLAEPVATATDTLTPTATHTPVPTATHTPSPTRTPTHTPTSSPTPTITPTPTATPILTPVPELPPAWDGVARRADVPILMYHYISKPPTANDRLRYGLSVVPEMFQAQLQLLQEQGFTTITLLDLYQHLADGRALPKRPIILTFDDGYLDNYTNAFPLLQKYGMTGTFFVLTGRADAGDPAYLSWDMIQEMSAAGMDIQLHAREHYDLRNRSYEWLVYNIIGGRESIEGHIGRPVNFIAYTSGKYDAGLLRFLGQTNFWAAVTTQPGSQHTPKDSLLWTRVRISGQSRLSDFAKLLKINSTSVKSPSPTATSTVEPTPLP